MDLPTSGARIRFFRQEAGLTVGQLADALKCSRPCVSQWENGVSNPARRLPEIAAVLGVSVKLLVVDLPATGGEGGADEESV